MNTDKTLRDNFIDHVDNPIWYYKELTETTVDYVIYSLLKETFVVEIDGSKHEITFGKNRKGEIHQCIKYNDIKKSGLCSFEVVRKGFTEGKWFAITDIDTSDEFKDDYNKRKEEHEKQELKEFYKDILLSALSHIKDLTDEDRLLQKESINSFSFEELEQLFGHLMKKLK
jgi:hypothetical protein